MNGIQDARIAQRRGVAFALQFELRIVDAPGNVSGEDYLESTSAARNSRAKEKRTRNEASREGLIGFLPFDQHKGISPPITFCR